MSEHGEGQERRPDSSAPQTPVQRRRLPAGLVFEDPLDRPTADDTDTGWGGPAAGSDGRDLDWYLNEKPPHHG